MASRFKPFRSRAVIVAVWLAVTFLFLSWNRPGFWRSPYPRFQHAQELAANRRVPEAIDEMTRAAADDPDNAGYAEFKGYLELDADRLTDAQASFSRALTLAPERSEARLGLADALIRQGRVPEALPELALLRPETLTPVQRFRRQSLRALGMDYTGALDDADLLETGLTAAAELREALRWAMSAQDWPQAVALADRVMEATDDDLRRDAAGDKAIALRALGRLDEALAMFDLGSTDANLSSRAETCLQLKDYSRAAELCREWVTQDTGDVTALRQLAFRLEQAGQRETAVAAYRSALGESDDAKTRLQLVMLLNTLRRYDQAWSALARLPRPSTDTTVLRLQAATAFWSGRLQEASRLYAALKTLNDGDRATASDLAFELSKAGEAAQAETLYRRLLADRDEADLAERLAILLNSQKRHGEAWSTLRPISTEGASVPRQELLAKTPFWAGAFADAAPRLAAYLERFPDDIEAARDLAEAYRQTRDSVAEERALAAYLQRRPDDIDASERRGQLLEQAGRADEAAGVYRAVVELDPNRVAAIRGLGYLEERAGRLQSAIRYDTQAWERASSKDPDLALTLARLHRRTGAPAEAVVWYTRYVDAIDPAKRRDAETELAWAYLEAGNAAAARQLSERLAAPPDAGGPQLAVAARASDAAGIAGDAAAYLERLAGLRPLSVDEQRWLIGVSLAAGSRTAALQRFDRLLAGDVDSGALLEAIGDLRWDALDHAGALDAYTKARAADPTPALTLKVARLLAVQGRFDAALDLYRDLLQSGSSQSLWLEAARVGLSAGAFDEAEGWAREAGASGEREFAAQVVLAEAIHLQGRLRDSLDVVDRLPAELWNDPEAVAMYARLLAARNQHLQASQLFGRAIELGAATPGELWYASANSALRLANFVRASDRLAKSSAAGGVAAPLIERLDEAIQGATAPILAIPLRAFGDSHGISLAQSGVRGQIWPDGVPLVGEVTSGRLSQRGVGFTRTTATGGFSNLFVLPALTVTGRAGLENYGSGRNLWLAELGATAIFDQASTVSLGLRRGSLWSDQDVRDPHRYSRVVDLAALGPDFSVSGFNGRLNLQLSPRRELAIDAGADRYQDANARAFISGHYQMVTSDRPGNWTVVAPNVYYEAFRRASPFYFTPDQYLAIGGRWQTIRSTPRWTLELQANPALSWLDARTGFAVDGVADLTRRWERTAAGLGGFIFYDQRGEYLSWRLSGQFSVRVGR